jgi:sigma-E factor negative regulatory protein RseB
VSARAVLVVGAVAGLAGLATVGLAAYGSVAEPTAASSYAGWTGRSDPDAAADRDAMTPDDAVAVALLERAADAAGTVAWTGRAVTVDRMGTAVTDLSHVPGRGTTVRTVGQDSEATVAPDGRSGSIADAGRQLTVLRTNYRVVRAADLDCLVAGRATEAVVAYDADGTQAARFWLDAGTGLLLAKELVAPDGTVWSRADFERVRITPGSEPAITPAAATDEWSEPFDAEALAAARQGGCPCPEELPGGLVLLDTRRAPAGVMAEAPVVHQLFTDGLSAVSLFTFPGSLTGSDAEGLSARGFVPTDLGGQTAWVREGTTDSAAVSVVWAVPGSVLTLVTDDVEDPRAVVTDVVAALPPAEATGDGLLDRVRRGWDRLTGAAA